MRAILKQTNPFLDNVDECALKTHNCHADATCKDNIGSFTCTCKNGFSGNGTSCQGR